MGGRVLNDFEYLELACGGTAGPPDTPISESVGDQANANCEDLESDRRLAGRASSFSRLLSEDSVHVVVLGCGPASELWSLLVFLQGRFGDSGVRRVAKAALVDAAPWGATLQELEKLFVQQATAVGRVAEADAYLPPIEFIQADLIRGLRDEAPSPLL